MTRTASAHGLTSPRATDWRDRGACLGEDPEIFFANPLTGAGALETEQAKTICGRCPVQDACLQFALDNSIGDGIYGGLTEDERTTLRRSTTRRGLTPEEAAEKAEAARQPKRARTLQTVYDEHTKPLHDHIVWTGPDKISLDNRSLTAKRIAFILDRGRDPDGSVRAECGISTCVLAAHIADEAERTRCGTRPGYLRHRRRGETPCDPCTRANADADNRLRWTGSTKAVA